MTWDKHPAVPTGKDLPLNKRAADLLRKGMGSWTFILTFIAGMGVWAWMHGPGGIDPFPYILLNLFLSMLAGLQGSILLISSNRQDQIASGVAIHTLENTEELRTLLSAIAESNDEIRNHLKGEQS